MRTAHPSSKSQFVLSEVTKRYGDHVVLDRTSVSIRPGEKVGVIGENGSGKSTLLRLIAGTETPGNGAVTVVAPGGTGYLPQTLDLPPAATVQDAIDLALADLRDLRARMARAEAALGTATPAEIAEYGELVERFEARGGYEADTRVEVARRALGVPDLARDRALGTLSGGERSRLTLAATLAASPELLLLDEPTNDLDDEAAHWLEEHLRRHRGTVVAVTHDRAFLNRVTSAVIEVDHDARTVRRYGNGYAGYLAAKAAARQRHRHEYEAWREDVRRHEALADTNIDRLSAIPRKAPSAFSGAGAFRARSRSHGAMSRIRAARQRLRELQDDPVPVPPEPLRFAARPSTSGAGATRGDGPVAELTGVHVPGRLHVESLRIDAGRRVLVTGPNGAGKTTLLRVLAGELAPAAGSVRRPPRVGYLRQDGGAATGDERSLLRAFGEGRPGEPEEHADALLSLGLFKAGDLLKSVRALSAGQRRRLDLAHLVSGQADLVLLDEPTNHLSPLLVDELEEALAGYTGALVIVTHDRRMRASFEGRRLELRDGAAREPVAA
ncbi:ribosomal protection-like ABC-F family protein [Actinomadura sp. 7K507]|uniref:ribosomal protection-like ABC-F family protein n=1 Tax=Actinomadura sp. 7K507 TaxID=2530365 RepID=UPI001049ED72|nr:ABC-F family ATP-binding cassette domain-containing protein [Actinomadura sp. 7K507]TDC96123.1 ABC-F family ATP-binding cassette domain-containing protein [Actinomadura sp. 7K507]